jgi:predicted methyltransferase
VNCARGRIGERNFRSRNNGSRLVGDDAGYFGISLRESSRACQNEEQRQQEISESYLSHVTFLFSNVFQFFVSYFSRFPIG